VIETSKIIMLEHPTRAVADSPAIIHHLHQCAPFVDLLENLLNGCVVDSAKRQLGWGLSPVAQEMKTS
jgi:hypothetical protein